MSTSGSLITLYRNTQNADAGAYKVVGQTLRGGDGYRARVILSKMDAIFPMREAWSEDDGSFSFENLAAGGYLVIAIDKSAERNAVVYAFVSAVPM